MNYGPAQIEKGEKVKESQIEETKGFPGVNLNEIEALTPLRDGEIDISVHSFSFRKKENKEEEMLKGIEILAQEPNTVDFSEVPFSLWRTRAWKDFTKTRRISKFTPKEFGEFINGWLKEKSTVFTPPAGFPEYCWEGVYERAYSLEDGVWECKTTPFD